MGMLPVLAVAALIVLGLVWLIVRFLRGGDRIRSAHAAIAAAPRENLGEMLEASLARTLDELCKRTQAGEKQAAFSLEIALACAERDDREKGGSGGVAFRAQVRPVMVGMMRQLEAEQGDIIRKGVLTAREVVAEALETL